jgi:asparagine synthase (glutamine-hydrolysing)
MMRRQRARIGLESRHPMLSRAFIEFSLQTPAAIKRKGATNKAIHRAAMVGILPEVILQRTTKANFTNTKIDSQFAQYVASSGREALVDLCDPAGLERVLQVDFASPEGDYWAWEIWGLYASAAFLYQQDCVA